MEFGHKAFAERSSLQWVFAIEGAANQFCSATKLGHYLFRDCINLATFVLQEAAHPQELPARMYGRELAQGCLSSTGISTLVLTRDFQVLAAHACDNCKLLKPTFQTLKLKRSRNLPLCTALAFVKSNCRPRSIP